MNFLYKFAAKLVLGQYSTLLPLPSDTNRDFSFDFDYIATFTTCQKILAENLSKLDLEIKINNQDYPDHYLFTILKQNPNAWQTSYNFFNTLEHWRSKYGNAYAYVHRDFNGRPKSFELIHPHEITGYKIMNGQIYYYHAASQDVINGNDILHFKFMSNDGVFGLAPWEILTTELNNIYQGKTSLNQAYKKNMRFDKYIESEFSNFSSDKTKQAISDLKKEYQGAQSTGSAPLLPKGFKVVPVSQTSFQDAEVINSLQMSQKEIFGLYGVPPVMAGEGSAPTNVEQLTLNFATNTMQPIARHYEQEMDKKLITTEEYRENIRIKFDINSMHAADLNARSNYYKTMKDISVASPNSIAKKEGFPTYEGGDVHLTQMQYVPVENLGKIQEQAERKKLEQ